MKKHFKESSELFKLFKNYPKIILTMDDDPEVQYEGIRRINARDWLVGLIE